jgi:hypothetical protein
MLLVLFLAVFALCVLIHLWLHVTNPYAKITVFKNPYSTRLTDNNEIDYEQNYRLRVYTSRAADLLGYYKSGFLIVQNTLFGGKPAQGETVDDITDFIHRMRFDPRYPYLISGDQFSVLYPRNLGVFYNQLLDPAIATSKENWEHRQRIYLQSVLLAIDGLSAGDQPRTTIVPIGRKSVVLTQVHPGGIGSDQVYGLFYALQTLRDGLPSQSEQAHKLQTNTAARKILRERHKELQHILDIYLQHVYDPDTTSAHHRLHLSSARDGVIRASSLYDNIILYETVKLAGELGLRDHHAINLPSFKRFITQAYWNEERGFYNDDIERQVLSADWLIGYVTGFFDLQDSTDLERTRRTIEYLEKTSAVKPFPIKYQVEGNTRAPYFVRKFVPNYGGDAIWSYWGAQYITLLLDLHQTAKQKHFLELAQKYCDAYDAAILRDRGFAETFTPDGKFLTTRFYKSIRVTGWIVQFDHAKALLKRSKSDKSAKNKRKR